MFNERLSELSLFLCLGLGGALGYLTGAIDWGPTYLGRLMGSEFQVMYFFAVSVFLVLLIVHLFSIPEVPLQEEGKLETRPLLMHDGLSAYGSIDKVQNGTLEIMEPKLTSLPHIDDDDEEEDSKVSFGNKSIYESSHDDRFCSI